MYNSKNFFKFVIIIVFLSNTFSISSQNSEKTENNQIEDLKPLKDFPSEESRLETPPPPKFFSHGPRIGASLLYDADTNTFGIPAMTGFVSVGPVISQFGYHVDFDIVTKAGFDPVAQIDLLIGGVDQGLAIPSLSAVIGIRISQGFEIGVGPNLSITRRNYESSIATGIIVVIGYSFRLPNDNIAFPVDFAIVASNGQYRFTLLAGFNFPD